MVAVGESGWHGGEFGVSTVGVPAGVARLRAQVLPAVCAELALATGVAQPGDADAISYGELAAGVLAEFHDFGDHFVSRYDVMPVNRQVSLGDV